MKLFGMTTQRPGFIVTLLKASDSIYQSLEQVKLRYAANCSRLGYVVL
jgi:hypothetical protein